MCIRDRSIVENPKLHGKSYNKWLGDQAKPSHRELLRVAICLLYTSYIAATGRVRGADDVIAYHVRQSFKPGEITPEEANRLGVEFAKRFTKGNHAFVVLSLIHI